MHLIQMDLLQPILELLEYFLLSLIQGLEESLDTGGVLGRNLHPDPCDRDQE